ncbi:MAG: hypothetical protein KDC35_07325 [Acidobacteria bacterium]|nr:hypothetical protein [Acidobacteriota bacterium]
MKLFNIYSLFVFVLCCNTLASNVLGDRVVPHLAAANGGFETFIYLTNTSRQPKTITLSPYSMDGVLSMATTHELKSGEILRLQAAAVMPGASHFFVSGSNRVSVSVSFESASLDGASAYLGEQPTDIRSYLVYPASTHTNSVWEGYALVNVSRFSANVVVSALDDSGKPMATQTFSLASGAKNIGLYADFFGADLKAAAVRVECDHPIALMSLAGVTGEASLWNVVPVREPTFSLVEFSDDTPDKLTADVFEIDRMVLDEELLRVQVTLPTSCAYETELIMSGGFKESLPVQADLVVVYRIVPGYCARQFESTEFTFDLTSLAENYRGAYGEEGDIEIHVFDSEGEHGTLLFDPY